MSLDGTSGDPSTNDPAAKPLIKPGYPSGVERERRFARFLKLQRNHNAWIVVNTDTFHICNNRDAFATYESTKPFVVKTVSGTDPSDDLGLNNTYTACGIGQVWLSYKTLDERPEKRYLQDVLHIPDAFANVVSLPRLFQKESAYKLDAKRGIAFSIVDDHDLAWFPPDFQGLFCLALNGETPYFPGPSSLHRRAPVRSLSVHSVGMPLPFVVNRFDKLSLVIKLIRNLDPRDEQSRNFHSSQKTEFTVAQILDLLNIQKKRAWNDSEAAALSCPRERCFYRGAFVFKRHGDFAVCKDRDLFYNFASIPPQPASKDSAEVMGIGDLYLDILFSNGSTGKLFIAGVLYAPKNPVNQITYNCLFDPKMVCEGGSFDNTTGIAADKNGGEVAWFTTCHLDGTLCLRQPDVRVLERKSAAPCVSPGLASPEKPTSIKATKLVNGKEISSARERAHAVSSGENKKVTFLTPNGSVGQIGAPLKKGTASPGAGLHSTDSPPVSSNRIFGKNMLYQAEAPGNNEPAQQIDQAAFTFRSTDGECRPAEEMTGKEHTNDEAVRRRAVGPDLKFEPQPSALQTAIASRTSRQAKVPETDEDAQQIDQKASSSKGKARQVSPAAEATSKEKTHPGSSPIAATTKDQTHIPKACRSQTVASPRPPPSDAEFFDMANDSLSALVAEMAKKQPDLGLGELPANLRLPPFPSRTDPFFPLINHAIKDFCNLTHCFTTIAAAGKLTAMQKDSYSCALSKIAMLSDYGPASLAEMIMYDADTPSTPPSLDISPTPPSPATPRTPRNPPPACEELQFHDSPRALVERILLYGRAATKAIAGAGLYGDARAWHLATIVGGLAGPKVGSRISRQYQTAAKKKAGDTNTAMLERDDVKGSAGAALGSNHEKEDLSLKMKEAIDDVAHQRLRYAVETDWDGTGRVNRKTTLDRETKKGEGATANVETVTERAAPREKPSEDDTRREGSAQDRPFAKDILQAAKEPFIAGLLKLNEQNLALREKHAAQQDAAKEEPAQCKEEQSAMAALCKVGQQNLPARLERMALQKENERLLDLVRNGQTSQEIRAESPDQKRSAIASMMKLIRKQNLTREEQKALLGDEKVRVLLDLAARCEQEALAALGPDADDGKKRTENEKENETKEGQTVEKGGAAEEQTAEDKTPNGMKDTEQIPVDVRQQSPTPGKDKAAMKEEYRCTLESLLQKRNLEKKKKEKGESS